MQGSLEPSASPVCPCGRGCRASVVKSVACDFWSAVPVGLSLLYLTLFDFCWQHASLPFLVTCLRSCACACVRRKLVAAWPTRFALFSRGTKLPILGPSASVWCVAAAAAAACQISLLHRKPSFLFLKSPFRFSNTIVDRLQCSHRFLVCRCPLRVRQKRCMSCNKGYDCVSCALELLTRRKLTSWEASSTSRRDTNTQREPRSLWPTRATPTKGDGRAQKSLGSFPSPQAASN